MHRLGRFALALAMGMFLSGIGRAQSDLPREGLDNRPPDLFPPAPSADDAPRPGPRGPTGPLAGLGALRNVIPGPGYAVDWIPARPVANQGRDLGIVRQDLALFAPIWREGDDTLFAGASVRNTHVYTDALLPDTGRRFPKDLWNANIGLAYLHQFNNGWTGGAMVSVGSASDKPFNTIREMNVIFAGFLRVPACAEEDFWLFSLFYSPGGLLNFPVPGVAYQWNYSERFHLTIGLPFAVMWKPTPDLTFTASYLPLTNIRANLDYRLEEGVHLFGGYEFLNEAYFLADRKQRFDRFLGFEQRVLGGVKFDVFQSASLDLHAGYAFGRYFGEGRNQGATLHDRIDIAPGAFLGASLRIKF